MASYKYADLKKKYDNFRRPTVIINVNGKDIMANKLQLVINNIDIELTSGFEASIASFDIFNSFDEIGSAFLFDEIKKYIMIGSEISIALGYLPSVMKVFTGTITRVNFIYRNFEKPHIQVTAMDVKGIMMANSYTNQLKAKSYGEAVKEILQKTAYSKLQQSEIIKKIAVTDTPDKGKHTEASTDFAIEMVEESDYEFVVKAAKRFNYEFFTDCGTVYFRKAKADTTVIMELTPATGLRDFDIEYDITGIVEEIETRGMDTGKGKVISSKKKFTNKLSFGNKAKALIAGSRRVYIDPTVDAVADAECRTLSLMEDMSYRFGTLSCETIGMPELAAGRFAEIKSLGDGASNKFYLYSVRHVMDQEGYRTYLKGKAASVKGS